MNNEYKTDNALNNDISQRNHCKIPNTSHTKFQNLNDSRLILELSLPNPLKPGVKLRMKI